MTATTNNNKCMKHHQPPTTSIAGPSDIGYYSGRLTHIVAGAQPNADTIYNSIYGRSHPPYIGHNNTLSDSSSNHLCTHLSCEHWQSDDGNCVPRAPIRLVCVSLHAIVCVQWIHLYASTTGASARIVSVCACNGSVFYRQMLGIRKWLTTLQRFVLWSCELHPAAPHAHHPQTAPSHMPESAFARDSWWCSLVLHGRLRNYYLLRLKVILYTICLFAGY